MKIVIGVDLGSTTSKAVILDESGAVLGKGITNSRSNYEAAVNIARTEALVDARFNVLRRELKKVITDSKLLDRFTQTLTNLFRLEQYETQLAELTTTLNAIGTDIDLREIIEGLHQRAKEHFRFGSQKSAFFRDLAGSDYMALATDSAKKGSSFEALVTLFDKAIANVEKCNPDLSFEKHIAVPFAQALAQSGKDLANKRPLIEKHFAAALAEPFDVIGSVGTGYGRARLPFPKECIRSEILCHGLGAFRMFQGTRTVLDIGGQDTKAIQVDERGIVTSFQMNDRCAAGCGRYLGYIADEMNLSLHELGPLADSACHPTRITSTCTVFAGSELRDHLAMGHKREDILAGLHRAMILRAMSLLSRSGGVQNQLTFTGGVANNTAAVKALRNLVDETYSSITLNISPESIYTGALGAATFAHRASMESLGGSI